MEFKEIEDGLRAVLNARALGELDETGGARRLWLDDAERASERGECSFEVGREYTRDGNPHSVYF